MLCPRRDEVFGPFHLPKEDEWQDRGGGVACSFCGSMPPDEFMAAVGRGAKVVPTDKSYKAYIWTGDKQRKFYFQHLSEEQMRRFVDLHNDGTLVLDHPGHFYVMPFFMGRE